MSLITFACARLADFIEFVGVRILRLSTLLRGQRIVTFDGRFFLDLDPDDDADFSMSTRKPKPTPDIDAIRNGLKTPADLCNEHRHKHITRTP